MSETVAQKTIWKRDRVTSCGVTQLKKTHPRDEFFSHGNKLNSRLPVSTTGFAGDDAGPVLTVAGLEGPDISIRLGAPHS